MSEPAEMRPVPALLRGAWRRSWIRFRDGVVDDTSTVVWIQLASRMADIRVPASHAELADRGSLAGCNLDDLRRLVDSESSTGHTLCSPIRTGDDGVRRATAHWPAGADDVAFQPVSAYPEPGLVEWSGDGAVMVETAPSGAYVERWERIPGSAEPLAEYCVAGCHVYIAGRVAIRVRGRTAAVPRIARLEALIDDAAGDRTLIASLVDCEFSLAERRDDVHGRPYVVTASTHPWQVGEVIDVAVR